MVPAERRSYAWRHGIEYGVGTVIFNKNLRLRSNDCCLFCCVFIRNSTMNQFRTGIAMRTIQVQLHGLVLVRRIGHISDHLADTLCLPPGLSNK